MHIRNYAPNDFDQLMDITLETFRPFYEKSFPALMDHDLHLVEHQHGHWREDYQQQLAILLGKGHCLVAAEGPSLLGYVIWRPDQRADHAHVEILAVSPTTRRSGVGQSLMEAAMDQMRADGRQFVELGTDGDWFHAPARALYERLGFRAVPLVAYLRRI